MLLFKRSLLVALEREEREENIF